MSLSVSLPSVVRSSHPSRRPSVHGDVDSAEELKDGKENGGEEVFLPSLFNNGKKERIEKLARDFVELGKMEEINESNYNAVIVALSKIKSQSLASDKFNIAHKCREGIRWISSKYAKEKRRRKDIEKYNSILGKMEVAQAEYDDLNERWTRVINIAMKKNAQEMKEMRSKKEKYMEEFIKMFTEQPPPNFRKLSPKIIELKYSIKKAVMVGDDMLVEEMREECDRMEKKEREQHMREWKTMYLNNSEDLEMELEYKCRVKEEQLEKEIEKMERYKKTELFRAQNVISYHKNKLITLQNNIGPCYDQIRVVQPPATARVQGFSSANPRLNMRQRRMNQTKPNTPRGKIR